jgi:hypothetical protein
MRAARLIPFCCPPPQPIIGVERILEEHCVRSSGRAEGHSPSGVVFKVAPCQLETSFAFSIGNVNVSEYRWVLESRERVRPISFTVNKVRFNESALPVDITHAVMSGQNQISFQTLQLHTPIVIELVRSLKMPSALQYFNYSPVNLNGNVHLSQQIEKDESQVYSEEPEQSMAVIFQNIDDRDLEFGFETMFMPK